ncbi:YDG/SRA domain-containing protein [Winogradskyella thalassocola]|uniref:Putative restriction endonuclease n=1 Tax=Winogradskyella thalassocola TaxID=262004 RepID=A0A1G7ZP27_9FLAO|nr:YDG/SRA domain-containing protein [Winogradskyella thalassocola]SDH10327.1 putative restriction endonuclease [Winogradskyella thalassocola]
MSRPIIFGEIKGIQEGDFFEGRKEMMPTSFHRKWAAGIDGNGKEGTAAIVLSGGYEDDKDLGDEIIYTGAGGNDPNSKQQIEDQTWSNTGNAGLLRSMNEGLPVRVIRGSKHKSEYSPKTGYLYAGIFSVVDSWQKVGKSGFKICQVRLVYSGLHEKRKAIEDIELDYENREKKRISSTVLRIFRDTKLAHDIKKLYNYECQVCGTTIITKSGRYAEGAHIKPLGKPHNGNDNTDNLLCLCPNHHVMLDKGVFSIENDNSLIGIDGILKLHEKHKLAITNLVYHKESIYKS